MSLTTPSLLQGWPEPFCLDPCEEYPRTHHDGSRRRTALIDGNVGFRWWFWALETNQPRTPADVARFKLWMHRLAHILGFDGPSTSWAADWRNQFEAALAERAPPGTAAGTHEFVILRIEFTDDAPDRALFIAPFPSYEAAEVWLASPEGFDAVADDPPQHHIMQLPKGAFEQPLHVVRPRKAAGGVA